MISEVFRGPKVLRYRLGNASASIPAIGSASDRMAFLTLRSCAVVFSPAVSCSGRIVRHSASTGLKTSGWTHYIDNQFNPGHAIPSRSGR